MKSNFAENLKRLMFEKALTQEQLAKKMNLDQSRISRWKTGESVPSAKNIKKLAEILNISTEDLTNNVRTYDENNINKTMQLMKKNIKDLTDRVLILEKQINFYKENFNK